MLRVEQTDRTTVSLLFSLLVVERLVPFVLTLPGVLQNGAEDGLEQQDAQIDDQEGVHRPETDFNIESIIACILKTAIFRLLTTRGAHFSTAERFWDLHL